MDQWPGYEVERQARAEFFDEAKPSNPVVLTGDIHSNWVNDLKVDFDDPKSAIVGTEFVGTSISSGGDGADRGVRTAAMLAENPFVKYFNGQRGYVRCDDHRGVNARGLPGRRLRDAAGCAPGPSRGVCRRARQTRGASGVARDTRRLYAGDPGLGAYWDRWLFLSVTFVPCSSPGS